MIPTSEDLLLFEPFLWQELTDYPDLGAALLTAAARAVAKRVTLVCTQRQLLPWLFERHPEYILDVGIPEANGLSPRDLRRLLAGEYSRDWSDYIDADAVELRSLLFREALRSDVLGSGAATSEWLNSVRDQSKSPRLVGVSLYHFRLEDLAFLRLVRRTWPNSPLVVGGAGTAHISLEAAKEIVASGDTDYVVLGMGESALQALLTGAKLPPNVISREHSGAGYWPSPEDIPLLVPDFSESDLDSYGGPIRVLPLTGSYGCPWRRCAFCTHHEIYQNRYVAKRPPFLLAALRKYRDEYGVGAVVFHDEDVPPSAARSLSEVAQHIGPGLSFSIYALTHWPYAIAVGDDLVIGDYHKGVHTRILQTYTIL